MINIAYKQLIEYITKAKSNLAVAQLIIDSYGEEKDITQTIIKPLEEMEKELKTIKDILIENY